MKWTGRDSIFGNAGELFGWLGFLGPLIELFRKGGEAYGKLPEGARKAFEEKLPLFLGFSQKDESIWARLRASLAAASSATIDYVSELAKLMGLMEDYQVQYFRYVVVRAFVDSEAKGKPVKKETKGRRPVFDASGNPIMKGGHAQTEPFEEKEFVDAENEAFAFLKAIAEEIKAQGADVVLDRLINEQLILRDPMFNGISTRFSSGVSWFKANVLGVFGVTSVGELAKKVGSGIGNGTLAVSKNAEAGANEFRKAGISALKRSVSLGLWK